VERRHDWVIVASLGGERALPYCGHHHQPTDVAGSALAHAIHRASQIAEPMHMTPVVLDEHRPWWAPVLAEVPKQNLVIEPFDRGTAAGILLASVRLLRRDPKANVAILSAESDGMGDLGGAYRVALEVSKSHDACAGVTSDGMIDRLSWLPSGSVEMIVGSIQNVIGLFQATQPKLLHTFLKELPGASLFLDDALDLIYPFMPEVAFASGVLDPIIPDLAAARAPARTAAV
jgi:hypothetical protein